MRLRTGGGSPPCSARHGTNEETTTGRSSRYGPVRLSNRDSDAMSHPVAVAGSGLNELRALEYPRFEDYEYTFIDENESQNRLYWLGNGSTVAEDEGKPGTRAWHVTRRATLAKL